MAFDVETRRMIEANRANWDERTPIHAASEFYGSRAAAEWFAPFEWADMGPLEGREVVHLQCHLGTETIEFARRGARASGLDFSPASVVAARSVAAAAGVAVDFVESDVYNAVESLGAERFDLVYTGKGSVVYLPDLAAWAAQVRGILKPGGTFYLVEFHPLLNALGVAPGSAEDLTLRNDYLSGRGPVERDATRTYTDGPALHEATVAYEWMHGVGEVVSALAGAGLRVDLVRETPELPFPRWSSMHGTESGWFVLPDDQPRIPLLYAIRAVNP
ncbi:class I SAM-dependent methyltransferase [Labedaea rhizosphaerae]|uniref:Methyltransferase family protein n=1 Tax=Labedaea rhizosphaerae TaxID=598644 RepID=A0A4R6SIY6_LABRH|nr:class I SAM-dependent methyltransferase [Labedaea rhizosphaerae]TDQ04266.1 methyltransferase family protein [Labedaea rhizosphaerae]